MFSIHGIIEIFFSVIEFFLDNMLNALLKLATKFSFLRNEAMKVIDRVKNSPFSLILIH